MRANDWATFAYTVAGIIVITIGWWKGVRPWLRRIRATGTAIVETLVGRDPIIDHATGKELVPAQPGLGVRMATMESAIALLADANATLANHERRIGALEQNQIERIVTRAESANMWRAVADVDLLANIPEPESEDEED